MPREKAVEDKNSKANNQSIISDPVENISSTQDSITSHLSQLQFLGDDIFEKDEFRFRRYLQKQHVTQSQEYIVSLKEKNKQLVKEFQSKEMEHLDEIKTMQDKKANELNLRKLRDENINLLHRVQRLTQQLQETKVTKGDLLLVKTKLVKTEDKAGTLKNSVDDLKTRNKTLNEQLKQHTKFYDENKNREHIWRLNKIMRDHDELVLQKKVAAGCAYCKCHLHNKQNTSSSSRISCAPCCGGESPNTTIQCCNRPAPCKTSCNCACPHSQIGRNDYYYSPTPCKIKNRKQFLDAISYSTQVYDNQDKFWLSDFSADDSLACREIIERELNKLRAEKKPSAKKAKTSKKNKILKIKSKTPTKTRLEQQKNKFVNLSKNDFWNYYKMKI